MVISMYRCIGLDISIDKVHGQGGVMQVWDDMLLPDCFPCTMDRHGLKITPNVRKP